MQLVLSVRWPAALDWKYPVGSDQLFWEYQLVPAGWPTHCHPHPDVQVRVGGTTAGLLTSGGRETEADGTTSGCCESGRVAEGVMTGGEDGMLMAGWDAVMLEPPRGKHLSAKLTRSFKSIKSSSITSLSTPMTASQPLTPTVNPRSTFTFTPNGESGLSLQNPSLSG